METETLIELIMEFDFQTGCMLEIKDGKPYSTGDLDLRDTSITSLPEGLTVCGELDLRDTNITSLPDGLNVSSHLILDGTKITSLPKGLVVGNILSLENTRITSLPDDLVVGGSLYLYGTDITTLPEGLTVGGNLDIRGTNITSLPKGLIVGGKLILRDMGITPWPQDMIVGQEIFVYDKCITCINDVSRNFPNFLEWHDYKYIKADDVFSKVVSHKGNIYKVTQIGDSTEMYLITDGNGKWSHGFTLQQAKKDLIYKISNRDKSKYENLTFESELAYEEAIECYRVITGACEAGTRMFLEKTDCRKGKYTIAEIIRLTKGQYGNAVFEDFFSKVRNVKHV